MSAVAEPLNPLRRLAIEAWADRNRHAPQARAIRTLLEEIDRLRAESGPTPEAPCPLTSRQLSVIVAMANGRSRKAIARRLGIRECGVDSLRDRAYDTLGVATGPQAVAVCVRRGWIPDDELHLPDVQNQANERIAQEELRATAARLRDNPGQWLTLRTYTNSTSARQGARRVRSGVLAAFRPAGAYEAKHVVHDGAFAVRACYIGESAPAASGGAA